jgi:hypothetical protein
MGPKWHADHIIPCQCLDENKACNHVERRGVMENKGFSL